MQTFLRFAFVFCTLPLSGCAAAKQPNQSSSTTVTHLEPLPSGEPRQSISAQSPDAARSQATLQVTRDWPLQPKKYDVAETPNGAMAIVSLYVDTRTNWDDFPKLFWQSGLTVVSAHRTRSTVDHRTLRGGDRSRASKRWPCG